MAKEYTSQSRLFS